MVNKKIRKILLLCGLTCVIMSSGCATKKVGEEKPILTDIPVNETEQLATELKATPVPTETLKPTETPKPTSTPEPEPTMVPKSTVAAKGLYISGPIAGSRYFNSRFDLTQTTEINSLVIDVKDEFGKIMFKDKIKIADDLELSVSNIGNIDELIQRMKDGGVYSIARIVCFKDYGIINSNPEYAIHLKDGSIYHEKTKNAHVWLNPYNRELWDYIAEISIETAKLGFDEIQFDYVRFPTDAQMKNVEFTEDMTGGLSRTEILVEFGKYIMEKLEPYGINVSADVFGAVIISDVDAELIGQDYVELAKVFDILCPMIYPSHYANNTLDVNYPDLAPYDIIYKTLEISDRKLKEAVEAGFTVARIRPWLQDFHATWIPNNQPYTAVQIEEQIRACSDMGIEEWLFWDSKNNFDGYRDYVGQPYD